MARPADWRERAASELAIRGLRSLSPAGKRALVYEERSAALDDALRASGATVERWNRRALGGRPAGVEPPPGPFDLVFLRLPRSKAELEMAAHMTAAVAVPEARLLLYGAKDEGIGSAPRRLDEVFPSATTLAVGGHCRVWSLQRGDPPTLLRPRLEDWALELDPGLPGLPDRWISYPGVFAHGGVDQGTLLLARALSAAPPAARVLDFGCGTGLLGALQRTDLPGSQVDLLDVDAVALAAARANVPDAQLVLGDGLAAVGDAEYDRIVTNPSIHDGKSETRAVVERLVRAAPHVLTKKGSLWMVLQKRFAPERLLAESFRDVDVRSDDPVFRVWEARRPFK